MTGDGRLAGKSAVVTGGASGLGAGFARRFVAEGARVIVVDINVDGARQVCDVLGESAVAQPGDVSVEADVAAAVDRAVAEHGRLDIMVNNAGILGVTSTIAATDAGEWDRTLAVLLRSVFLGVKHAARVMIAQGSGSIINISSTAGVQGGLGPHAYTAAKHAVIGLTKSTAVELAGHGVRVNAICPGSTVSGMTAALLTGDPDALEATRENMAGRNRLGRAALPEDIAGAAVYLASDEAWYTNGHAIVVDGSLEALANKGLRWYGQ